MKESGIDILEKVERTLTEEEAKEFYAHQAEQVGVDELLNHNTVGISDGDVLT